MTASATRRRALRHHRVLVPGAPLESTPEDARAVELLVRSPDPRSARLGLELVSAMAALALPEVRLLVDDPRVEVRLAALQVLAVAGDSTARNRLAAEVDAALDATDAAVRLRAAHAAAVLDDGHRRDVVRRLLDDGSPAVHAAALDAVRAGDDGLVAPVVTAVDDPLAAVAACAAVRRLGDAALATVEQAVQEATLGGPGSGSSRRAARLLRAVGPGTDASDAVLLRWAGHGDREVGRVALERLAREAAPQEVARALDSVLLDDLAHAARVLTAVVALGPPRPGDASSSAPGIPLRHLGDDPLRGALADELVLVRDRVLAVLVARHGLERLGPVEAGVLAPDGPEPLALEALEVVLGPGATARVAPVLDPRDPADVRLRRLLSATGEHPTERGVEAVLRDLVEDRADAWRSPWVRACALRAASDRELAAGLDLLPARALGDPLVDEELARIR